MHFSFLHLTFLVRVGCRLGMVLSLIHIFTPALGENVVEICREACKAAKAHGVKISCDLNYRGTLWTRCLLYTSRRMQNPGQTYRTTQATYTSPGGLMQWLSLIHI